MANDHAQDRYDPPGVGTDWEKEYFGDINIGEVFRLRPDNDAKSFRKVKDGIAFDINSYGTPSFERAIKYKS